MKKLLFIFLTACAVTSCLDTDVECNHGTIIDPDSITPDPIFSYEYLSSGTGSWYEEEVNEEFRPTVTGKFYDKYCNLTRAGETEGTYEISDNGTRMTEYYKFMGQNMVADWKVSDVQELSFVISSETTAAHTYEKIVETYTMTVGQTQRINFATDYPTYSVKSYSSTNEHIVSVSAEGVITSNGEKGTAYIKIALDKGCAWAKVVVGDNYADLWYDYSVLLNCSYTQMHNLLGQPDIVSTEYDCYSYTTSFHDVIDYFNVFINPLTNVVEQVDLVLKEGVPGSKIISYMDARYYAYGENENGKFYYTSSTYEESRAILGYDKKNNCVTIVPAEGFLDLWKDYTNLFGQSSEVIKKEMTNNGFTFLLTDYSYAVDGSDYYEFPEQNNATMIGFVFNKDKKMCEYWIYLNTQGDASTIYDFLDGKYNYAENESDSKKGLFIFYNSDRSVRVTFSLEGHVKYERIGMEGPSKPSGLWPDYATALGKSHDIIVAEYGSPLMDDDSGIWYVLGTEYIDYLNFRTDGQVDEIKYISLILNSAVDTKTVTDYLGSLYTVFEKGTAPDGSQYAWINGATLAEATCGIIYSPADKLVFYQSLSSPGSVRKQFPSKSDIFNPMHEKNLVKNPFNKGCKMSFIRTDSQNKKQNEISALLLNKFRR